MDTSSSTLEKLWDFARGMAAFHSRARGQRKPNKDSIPVPARLKHSAERYPHGLKHPTPNCWGLPLFWPFLLQKAIQKTSVVLKSLHLSCVQAPQRGMQAPYWLNFNRWEELTFLQERSLHRSQNCPILECNTATRAESNFRSLFFHIVSQVPCNKWTWDFSWANIHPWGIATLIRDSYSNPFDHNLRGILLASLVTSSSVAMSWDQGNIP